VTATVHDDRVELVVSDTGAGLDEAPLPGAGIGLANIRERLALLYGERAALELEENAPRGFRARIVFPREVPASSAPFVPVMAAP
jgi:sensor histidine kinase YesM